MTNQKICGFCLEGKCRAGNHKDCDWASITFSKEGISKRMDEEREKIIEICKEIKISKDWSEIKPKIQTITDKISALETMHKILEKEMKTYKKIEDVIFMTTLSTTLLHARKIELQEKPETILKQIPIYSVGAVLFDLNNPEKILARSAIDNPLFMPNSDYEKEGFVCLIHAFTSWPWCGGVEKKTQLSQCIESYKVAVVMVLCP